LKITPMLYVIVTTGHALQPFGLPTTSHTIALGGMTISGAIVPTDPPQ
jgi:hypothetical protein